MGREQLPKDLRSFIWHFVKKQWKFFAAIQFFALAWAYDHTLWPYVVMLLIDGITNFAGDRVHVWSALATPIIFGITLWCVLEVFFRAAGFLMARAFPRLEAQVRMAMFEYVEQHSYDYFSNHFAGSIANKISDMTQGVTQILQQLMMLFVPVGLAVAISSVFFYRISPLFTWILLGWIIVHFVITMLFARVCARLSDVHAEARSDLAGKVVDVLTNMSNVRLFARSRYEREYVGRFQDVEQQKHTVQLRYIEWMKLALAGVSFLGSFLAINGYMLYSWQQGHITTGEIVFIFNTSWNISMMTWFASMELPNLFKEIGVCKQALSIIMDEHDIVDKPEATPLRVKTGEITFEHVTFHYLPGQNIFQDKTITINAGEKVGLVGYSGSGKSTFVHLILRYFDVEKGRILIDGQDIALVTQESLREQIAFIPQDASLFHRTLMENIRYGSLDADDEAVFLAAEEAHCKEFIERNPERYQALVGERGVKLSGGQRQRIAIARAILKNAPILILDEATSSLDSITERLIQTSLKELMKGRTTIVIAHRLSTLSDMDRILVFHEGKIIEEGTHEELLAAGGHYANLWSMQAGGFLPEEADALES